MLQIVLELKPRKIFKDNAVIVNSNTNIDRRYLAGDYV